MSIFASAKEVLFGSPKTIDDIFDKDNGHLAKIGGWIGAQQFTTQEEAELNATTSKAVQKFVVDTLAENTERSKGRRDIATLTIKFFFLTLFLSGILFPFNKEWAEWWLSIALNWQVGGLVSGVAGFFFGTHMLRSRKAGKQ